jgi:hypothetical protein
MKTFKKFDSYLQISLMIVAALFLLYYQDGKVKEVTMLGCYFFIAGWQFVSVVINLFLPGNNIYLRKWYYFLLAIPIVSVASAMTFKRYVIEFLLVALIAAPLAAVFYAFICYRESRSLSTL